MHLEGFIVLPFPITVDDYCDVLISDTFGKSQLATCGTVVLVRCFGATIGGRIVDRYGLGTGRIEADLERKVPGATVTFVIGYIIDGKCNRFKIGGGSTGLGDCDFTGRILARASACPASED